MTKLHLYVKRTEPSQNKKLEMYKYVFLFGCFKSREISHLKSPEFFFFLKNKNKQTQKIWK